MLVLLAGSGASVADEPEIYRCAQEDGTVAFQQMPCRPAAVAQPDPRDAEEAVTGNDASHRGATTDASPQAPKPGARSIPDAAPSAETAGNAERQPVPVSGDRADCEKSARDAIDAIDAELRASSKSDNDRARLDELLELTRQLRLCSRL